MNPSQTLSAVLATLALAGCNPPAVVTVPAPEPVAVPGPPGPAGATGSQGSTGSTGATGDTGATGQSGTGTSVIVAPPAASAPAN